ncbi:MAG: hypothetical protein QXI17_02200 [Candidatus Bilamarchaeaceae archaeon]
MDTATFVDALLQNYIALTGVFFIIATLIVSIIYLIGSFLMNEKIKSWAKMELYEIFYSIIIIVLLFSLVPIVTMITSAALNLGQSNTVTYIKVPTPSGYVEQKVDLCNAGQNIYGYENISACHLRLAIYYLRTIYEEGRIFGYNLLRTYSWTSMIAESSVTIQTIYEKMGMEMWVPWKGFFSRRNQVIEYSFKWLTRILFLTKFQEILIKYFAIAVFPIMLVSGGILRTFTFTRRLGGLLMALALTGYFIYPSIYALGGLLLIKIKEEARPTWLSNTEANPRGSYDPPIINTLYINASGNTTIGGITILEDYGKTQEVDAALQLMTPDERQKYIKEKGLNPSFDLGSKTSDSEKENIVVGAGKFMLEWFTYFFTHNIAVDTVNDWRDNGYIDITARITFFSVFFFIFSIFGSIAATRSIAMTLGGDIELAGLTRLI